MYGNFTCTKTEGYKQLERMIRTIMSYDSWRSSVPVCLDRLAFRFDQVGHNKQCRPSQSQTSVCPCPHARTGRWDWDQAHPVHGWPRRSEARTATRASPSRGNRRLTPRASRVSVCLQYAVMPTPPQTHRPVLQHGFESTSSYCLHPAPRAVTG
jgi:hypothetical protein